MTRSVRLVSTAASSVRVPQLDVHQRAVVDHDQGPLLVLAGPGTGKTTTLVEAIHDRIENRGVDPSQVLALTFSRKAAESLRDRVTSRLGRTISTPLSMTFHSFAYGLIRQYTPAELYTAPLRLLTAPQADVMIAELLDTDGPDVAWPAGLAVAARTRGFAREVASVIARAREKGADHEQLYQLGLSENVPEFVAAGKFLAHYLNSLDDHGATDYPDLARRAVIEATAHQHELREQYRYVFVDEYQDTDPGQVALLQALCGDGGNLVAVGDPHQSIYGFRGAEVRGILDFPTEFPDADARPAPTVVLSTTRRFGPELLAATQRIAANLPLHGSLDKVARQRFAHPVAAPATDPGRVEVATFAHDRSEVEWIADKLRRAHLEDGVPWSQMAVLARSGRSTLPVLRRMLTGAGVPVEVAGDEIPLAQEAGARPLLDALELIVLAGPLLEEAELASTQAQPETQPAPEVAAESAGFSDPDETVVAAERALDVREDLAESLALSPMGGMTATGLRALGRALRQRELARAVIEKRPPRSSRTLVAHALVHPEDLVDLDPQVTGRARTLADLLRQGRAALSANESVDTLLWLLWDGSDWGRRLKERVLKGGAAARRAHRDLDAVLALFDTASRAEDQRGRTSARNFLAEVSAQQIPADTLVDKGVRGDSVRLLTAHRSKGLEWDVVVVAHVQEGVWPDVRRRASLLGTDRLQADSYGQLIASTDLTASAMLAEERRLFYVACTRARSRLLVTAIASNADDGEQASRFLAELMPDDHEIEHLTTRPSRPLTLAGLVAELRRTLTDPDAPQALRMAAARRLATLRAEELDGRALVPAADPHRWWGTAPATHTDTPVRDPQVPIKLSASTVTSIGACAAQWFLEHEAGGAVFSGAAAGFGNVVHKIAEHVATGELADADIDTLMGLVDQVWDRLPFRTPWSREKERAEAHDAISRFLNQHRSPAGRELLGTEVSFSITSTLPDGQEVKVRGFADRIELAQDGTVVVVDLKTGKRAPTKAEISEHPQLGIYQWAVSRGAFQEHAGAGARPGGAELWQLRKSTDGRPGIQGQEVQRTDDDGWLLAERQLAQAAGVIASETFDATPGKQCDYCSFAAMCPAQNTAGVIR